MACISVNKTLLLIYIPMTLNATYDVWRRQPTWGEGDVDVDCLFSEVGNIQVESFHHRAVLCVSGETAVTRSKNKHTQTNVAECCIPRYSDFMVVYDWYFFRGKHGNLTREKYSKILWYHQLHRSKVLLKKKKLHASKGIVRREKWTIGNQ